MCSVFPPPLQAPLLLYLDLESLRQFQASLSQSVILRKALQTDTEGGVSVAYGHLQPSAEEFGHSGGMGHL